MTNEHQMHAVGTCRICGTGALGLRECGGCGEIVVLCDECDAVWTSADFSAKPHYAGENDLPCPYCATSLLREPSRWAAKSRIDKLAWLQTALQTGELEVSVNDATTHEPSVDREDQL